MAFFVKSVRVFPNILLPAPAGSQPLLLPVASPRWGSAGSSSIRALLGGCQRPPVLCRASAAPPPSTWILSAKRPAWEGILSRFVASLLLGKPLPGVFTFLPQGSPRVGNQIGDLEHKDLGFCFVMTSKIPWRRNPGVLKHKHSLFL